MTENASKSRPHGISVAALVLGIVTVILLILGSIWAALVGGMGILGVAAWTAIFVGAVGVAGVIVGIIALVRSHPRVMAIVGIVLSAVPLILAAIVGSQLMAIGGG